MAPQVEKVLELGLQLGEGPHWDAETQSLYFVDINAHTIHKYVPSIKKHTSIYVGNYSVSIIIPVKGLKDHFVISMDRQLAIISWDGEIDKYTLVKKLYEVDEGTPNVFNDGKCDQTGRLWAGTLGHSPSSLNIIPDKKGALYSFQNDVITKQRSEVGISNGLAFNPQLKKMYYIDSYRGTIDQYEFDITEGTISNLRSIFTSSKHGIDGIFDGMTIDTEGNLWVAIFNGSRILKIDPNTPETLLETIPIPGKQVTSLVFGGPNLDELYVTTARVTVDDVTPSSSDDGAIYRVTEIAAKGFAGDEVTL